MLIQLKKRERIKSYYYDDPYVNMVNRLIIILKENMVWNRQKQKTMDKGIQDGWMVLSMTSLMGLISYNGEWWICICVFISDMTDVCDMMTDDNKSWDERGVWGSI